MVSWTNPVNPKYANLSAADTQQAQHVIEAWLGDEQRGGAGQPLGLAELRGIIAVALADARWDGYQDGLLAGRLRALAEIEGTD